MLVTKTTNGDDVVALTHAAVEASSEALARAKSAAADLLDTGETRAEHEVARNRHLEAAAAHSKIGGLRHTMAHASAAARHAGAATAHAFAKTLVDAAADDPSEDGSGMELAAMATSAAVALSARAHRATLTADGAV